MTQREANAYSPLALAFLGDAVYELKVREKLLIKANMPVGKLHRLAIERVCAEYQSKAVEIISKVLTEDEMSVMRRGRNSSGMTVPKHASVSEYRNATSLECLFGYLFLMENTKRIDELFDICWNILSEEQSIVLD